MRFAPVLAVLITALALYFSRAVLDQILTADGPVRVALLPAWPALAGFALMSALGLLWLDRRTVPRRTASAARPPLGSLVLPLFGLGLLLVPYLPVLPDRLPALQMLAGPVRAVIWLVIGFQLIWVLWQSRLVRADWLSRRNVAQMTIAVGLGAALLAGTAAWRLTGGVLYPAGDEPHYLIIAQSLWRDGDLKIENNHKQRDYQEYFANDLAPHYLTRGADLEIYSIHPIGMPVLIAPLYAAGGYRAVVFAFVMMAGLAAALMWTVVLRATHAAGAATFGVAAVAATSPFLFNAFAVYPEIPAALVVTAAFTLIAISNAPGLRRWVFIGLAAAALPWLSTKYAPMSAVLVMAAFGRAFIPRAPGALVKAALVAAPYGLSLAAWFYFFYAIWGIPLPQAPYGALVQTSPRYLVFGAPGLLFDQEYGLLPYAPVYILALTGLWAMWREGGESRRRAVEVVVIFAALLGTVGAFRIWWGGSASPGRPIVSGLLLLALPVATAFREAPTGSARRAAQHLLLWTSVGIAGILLLAQEGFLTANGRDGTSSLLEYLSPRWPAWTVAPSFIYHETSHALLRSMAWLALAAGTALLLHRVRTPRPGSASLATIAIASGALAVAMVVMPLLPASPAWPGIDARSRSRLPMLDEFDTVARPIAIEYTPMRVVDPIAVASRASLGVEAGIRLDPQPIRVLHNGRFSIPAGRYRLEIEWSATRSQEVLALQIGRTGDPWLLWPVEPRGGERWAQEFAVPMDMSFVGLRGSAELERAIKQVWIVPISVVDVGRRPRLPTVIAASRSGPVSLFYYDANAFPEASGFWVAGGQTTRVSVERHPSTEPLTLRLHSGAFANRLHLRLPGWSQTVTLQPQLPHELELAVGDRSLITLELSTDRAFVPSAMDPASTDRRPLGVWVEVVK